ncbi:MAG: DUF364 domain-containing protein [Candidatus Aminicenantes bacterium]
MKDPSTSKTTDILQGILSTIKEDQPVRDIHVCIYWTAVTSLRCGLASSMAAFMTPSDEPQVKKAGNLLPVDSKTLADLSLSSHILEASIGLAAINSALDLDESRFQELNAEDELKLRGEGKRMAVIGHFPFINRLRSVVKHMCVFELPGRERPGDLEEDKLNSLIPQAEVVAISSTTLINHTLGKILELVNPQSYTILLGPSTPLSPKLFDYGFDALSGSIVVHRSQVLRCICQGANFRQIRGIRKVTFRR